MTVSGWIWLPQVRPLEVSEDVSLGLALAHAAWSLLEDGLDLEADRGDSRQSVGAVTELTPDRSSRVIRIVTSVMTSASSMIPAATMYPLENPVARA